VKGRIRIRIRSRSRSRIRSRIRSRRMEEVDWRGLVEDEVRCDVIKVSVVKVLG
jgi:hypothetical protein